jgi:hypothetical protein
MHGFIAQKLSTVSDTDGNVADTSDSNDGKLWFAKAMRDLGVNGLMLHVLTGANERACYRYVSTDPDKNSSPPGYFIFLGLRTEIGWQLLSWIMDGCEVAWWHRIQRALRIAEQIDKLNLE